MPYIKDNLQWWALELLDGFGSHLNNYKSNKLLADNKILSLKEEGNLSAINRAYDKLNVKSDKSVQQTALGYLR